MFEQNNVNLEILKQRAYNLRWATVPTGVIPLTAADPDFPCAPEIADAIHKFTRERYLCYGPPEGLPAFKDAMGNFFLEKRNISVSPSLLFPVDSAAFGIYITCKAFLSAGDEAIIFDPVDFLFRYSVETVGGVAVPFAIPPGNAAVDFTHLESLVTKRTRMLCLCNPLNPTGKVFTKQELASFAAIAHKYNLIILSDEIWSDIIFAPHTYTSIASLDEATRMRTITVTGFSKSYGLAGLRIGAILAPDEVHFKQLMAASLHQSTIHGANVVGQIAATAALTQCQSWLGRFVSHLHNMKTQCVDSLNELPGFHCIAPEGCYVAFADITGTGKTSQEMADHLMAAAKVAVVPGLPQWFGNGAAGYIRISFATSSEILGDAMSRIKNILG